MRTDRQRPDAVKTTNRIDPGSNYGRYRGPSRSLITRCLPARPSRAKRNSAPEALSAPASHRSSALVRASARNRSVQLHGYEQLARRCCRSTMQEPLGPRPQLADAAATRLIQGRSVPRDQPRIKVGSTFAHSLGTPDQVMRAAGRPRSSVSVPRRSRRRVRAGRRQPRSVRACEGRRAQRSRRSSRAVVTGSGSLEGRSSGTRRSPESRRTPQEDAGPTHMFWRLPRAR